MELKAIVKVKVGKSGQILCIDFNRYFITKEDGTYLMDIPGVDAIKLIRYLCLESQNSENGVVTNKMILNYVYENNYNITEKGVSDKIYKLINIEIEGTDLKFADFIHRVKKGRYKIMLAESPFVEFKQPEASADIIKIPIESKTDLSEYAKYINETNLPSELVDIENIFSFRSKKIEFQGRKEEIENLKTRLSQGGVSVWALTGQGGSGKSRFALHFATKEVKDIAKAVWIDNEALDKLLTFNKFDYPEPVLFICDYASHYEDKLAKVIDKISRTKANAKFLLIERSALWYSDYLKKNNIVKEYAVKEPIILDYLNFTHDEYSKIMQDFSDALYGKDKKKIANDAQQQIIQKAKELSGKEHSTRCLFLLLVTDAYLRDYDIRHLCAQNLFHNYLDHSRKILSYQYGEETLDAGYRILAYTTACGGISFSDMKNHQAIQNEWGDINKQLKTRSKINQLFQRMSEINECDTVSAMKPDLIGEYLFLQEWNDLIGNQTDWLSALLKHDYSCSFFAMCLSDWKEESKTLFDLLSDRDADVEQKVACAVVFNKAVRADQSEEKQKEYAAQIKALDNEHSAAILKEYVNAVRFIFEHRTLISKVDCIAWLKEINLEYYICENADDQKHFAYACFDIATIYNLIGDYDNALEYYNKALAIFEKVLGTEHLHTASTYNSIGCVYNSMCDYDKALDYTNKALAICEKVLGTEHPDTALTYNSSGVVYHSMGDYDKALEYYNKALAIYEKVLGTEHLYTASIYNNIGAFYGDMGKHDNKIVCYNSTYNMTNIVCHKRSYYDIALEYCNKALTIYEKVFGTAHPDTASTYNNIGAVYYDIGDYDKALDYTNKALTIYEKVFGTEHPNTVSRYDNIGAIYYDKGDYDKALEYYNNALEIREKVLGTKHPDTASTYRNIGDVFCKMIEYENLVEYIEKTAASLGISPDKDKDVPPQ